MVVGALMEMEVSFEYKDIFLASVDLQYLDMG